MATILQFQPVRNPVATARSGLKAKVIIFPGVRYERRDGLNPVQSGPAASTKGKLPH